LTNKNNFPARQAENLLLPGSFAAKEGDSTSEEEVGVFIAFYR
jgi:hypothetical protein